MRTPCAIWTKAFISPEGAFVGIVRSANCTEAAICRIVNMSSSGRRCIVRFLAEMQIPNSWGVIKKIPGQYECETMSLFRRESESFVEIGNYMYIFYQIKYYRFFQMYLINKYFYYSKSNWFVIQNIFRWIIVLMIWATPCGKFINFHWGKKKTSLIRSKDTNHQPLWIFITNENYTNIYYTIKTQNKMRKSSIDTK